MIEFFDHLEEKSREKILYNIWKSRQVNDNELFKKLEGEIWEFRTLYNGKKYRLLSFWDKRFKEESLVIVTHGIIKKTSKMPKKEIEKAERIRQEYFKHKNK